MKLNRRDFLKGLGGLVVGLAAKIRPPGDKEESPSAPIGHLQEVVEDLTPEEDDQFWPAALSDHSCPSSSFMPAVGAWEDTMHSLSMQRAQWVQEHPENVDRGWCTKQCEHAVYHGCDNCWEVPVLPSEEDTTYHHTFDFEKYPPELHRGLRRLLELVEKAE